MKSNQIDVSVIIAAYNEENEISMCIDSLLRVDFPIDKFEIIVVNDGSTDNTEFIVKEYAKIHSNIKLITKNNGGKASAQNVGLKYSLGKYILITDADAIVEKNWISKMVNGLEKNDVVIGVYYSKENKSLLEKIQNSHNLVKFKFGGFKGRPSIGVNNGFHKSIIKSIGNFDESKTSVTDDFIKRAEKFGLNIFFDPSIVVLTRCTTNINGILKQKLRWYEGSFRYLKGEKGTFIDFLGFFYIGVLSLILFISLFLSLLSFNFTYFFISYVTIFITIFLFYLQPFVKLCKSNEKSYAIFFVGYIFLEMIVRILLIPYYIRLFIKPRKKPTFKANRF